MHCKFSLGSGVLGVVLLAVVLGACGPSGPPRDTSIDAEYSVPALRFAGVELPYALRRIAGETGLILVMDELHQQGDQAEDMSLERIDVDLPAGDLGSALEALYEKSSTFDYRVERGVLIVRSHRVLATTTALDVKDLPAASLDVDFSGLIKHISSQRPRTYLRRGNIIGQPVRKKVQLTIPDQSSVLEALIEFSRAANWGLLLRRAGFDVERAADRRVIAASTVEMLHSLKRPEPLSPWRDNDGTMYALAKLADRTGTLFCVKDRSLIFDNRGALNFRQRQDTGRHDRVKLLDAFAKPVKGRDNLLRWEEEDGIHKVVADAFDAFPTGRELLTSELKAGTFEGSLAELTRWVNANLKKRSSKVLMGGEITDGVPTAKIEIAEGETVDTVLHRFAKASNDGWVYVVRDMRYPHQPLGGHWAGAYLSRVEDWGPNGNVPLQ